MTKTFRLASSVPHWHKVGSKSAPAYAELAFQIAPSIQLALGLCDAKFHLSIVPIAFCNSHTIGVDYDCESDSTSSQSSGVENRHLPKIAAYPMRSRYESSRSGLSTIRLSFVAINSSATSAGSLS